MTKTLTSSAAALLAVLGLAPSCVSTWVRDEAESETAPRDYSAIEDSQLPGPSEPVDFTKHVKPILESKCVPCHSGTSVDTTYKLDNRKAAFSSSPSGPRIIPGRARSSLLLDVSGTHRNVAVMPPVGNRLTEAESRLLVRWINQGAVWPEGPKGQLHAH